MRRNLYINIRTKMSFLKTFEDKMGDALTEYYKIP